MKTFYMTWTKNNFDFDFKYVFNIYFNYIYNFEMVKFSYKNNTSKL